MRFAVSFTMRSLFTFLCCLGFALALSAPARGAGLTGSRSRFVYRDANGRVSSAIIVRCYQRVAIVHPLARIDPRLDPKLARAATIAEERANAFSKARCWRYVKEALVASGAIDSYPKTNFAWQAGEELVHHYGFTQLAIRDPYAAPIGAILVYGGNGVPGHVAIRTRSGFASDYRTSRRCKFPLLAIYAKYPSA